MRRKSQKRWLIPLLGLIAFCPALRAQDVVFIANKEVSVSAIKTSDLHAIFTGEKTRLADGSHVVPVLLKGGPVHEVFLKNYCDQTPNEFRAQWQKAVFTGQGSMPKAFDSEAAVIEYVAQTPGAVGYVSHFSAHVGVKALTALK